MIQCCWSPPNGDAKGFESIFKIFPAYPSSAASDLAEKPEYVVLLEQAKGDNSILADLETLGDYPRVRSLTSNLITQYNTIAAPGIRINVGDFMYEVNSLQ